MHLDSVSAWCWLFVCTGTVALILVIVHLIHSLGTKRKVSLFYCWLGALAVWGGALAFLLPIALNSGFGKDHDGSALRQALLYATGGVLAVITLGETHRKNSQEKEKNENDHIRQVHAERRSRYTTAVEQLANEKAPVRLGGIYTLTGLVDEWLADDSLTKDKQKEEGQVIINNLCSYIRSPFPLAEKIDEYEARKELKELESKKLNTLLPDESPKLNALRKRFEDSAEYQEPDNIAALQAVFHEEQDVRRAIFEEMSKRSSRVSVDKSMEVTVTPGAWSCFKFDFSRAPIFYPLNNLTIEQGQFTSARFYGEADFQGAKFTKDANFRNAKFTGNADFRNTEFTGIANFRNTEFTGTTSFRGRGVHRNRRLQEHGVHWKHILRRRILRECEVHRKRGLQERKVHRRSILRGHGVHWKRRLQEHGVHWKRRLRRRILEGRKVHQKSGLQERKVY